MILINFAGTGGTEGSLNDNFGIVSGDKFGVMTNFVV